MTKLLAFVTGWEKKMNRYLFISGIIISLLITLYSCIKDPDNIGRDLLPASDNLVVSIDSSTLIGSYTISDNKIPTSQKSYYVLGSQKDSIFGLGSASILTQFHPVLLNSVDSTRTLDSLILFLSSSNHFGDSLSQLKVRVFELNQKLKTDTNYYSDINPAEYYSLSSELADATFSLGDSLIRIKITDPEFINKFETLPDSVFKDLKDFADQFYGFFISVDPVTEQGGYTYLDMPSSYTKLVFYYNGDTISDVYNMGFSTYAAKANVFSHDYAGFPIAVNLDLPGGKDSLMFIDGLAGTSGRIIFPDSLKNLRLKEHIAINRAELIFPIDTLFYPSLSKENYPSKLFLLDEADNPLYDYEIDKTGGYYGGTYNKTLNAYVFNIGLHLQSFISGKIDNLDLKLISFYSDVKADHVILKGATSVNAPIKLKVIYTEFF